MSQAAAQASAKKSLLVNVTWLFGDKLIRMALGLALSVIMARILGPEELGKWNYAESFLGMFLILTTLGLDSIVVRELVKDKSKAYEVLGTAAGLKLAGTFLAIAISYTAISLLRPDDETTRTINLILATASVFQMFEVIDYWFRSQMQSKYTVLAKNTAFILSCSVKILLLLNHASIEFVALCAHLEFFIGSMFLLYYYQKQNYSLSRWSFQLKRAKFLLSNSWPLIISSSAVQIQAKIDQVMIGDMLGDASAGQYSLALRLIEVLGFIPVVIATACAPIVTKAKIVGAAQFEKTLLNIYRIMFILFVVTALPIYFLSDHIVTILYGSNYTQAGSLLSIFGIRLLFINLSVAKSLFITNESLFKYTLITSIIGAGTNVLLNYYLIPIMGVKGSIVASIISFTISVFLVDVFFAGRIRGNLKLMLGAILTFWNFKLTDMKVGDQSDRT